MPTLRTTLEEFQPAGLAEKRQALDDAIKSAKSLGVDPDCPRRLNIDPPCRSNIDPGRVAAF
jgi:hypothetical protein